jgi:hypothetical protein
MKQVLFVLLMVAASHAGAQTESAKPADPAMDEALRDYSVVAGGWYVNQRCWFVTGEARDKFTRDLEVINVALVRDLGRTERLREIQQAVRIGASSPPYDSCGAEAEELVNATSNHAGLWSDAIRRIVADMAAEQARREAQDPQSEATE